MRIGMMADLVIVQWTILLLFLQGLVYLSYLVLRKECLKQVQEYPESSTKPFLAALLVGVIVIPFMLFIFAVTAMLLIFLLVAIAYGLIGWRELYRQRQADRAVRAMIEANKPTPKFQFRILDLWTAAVPFAGLGDS